MGQKTLIAGTSYAIKNGTTLINGSGFQARAGKTLVAGTAYDISLAGHAITVTVSGGDTNMAFININGQNPPMTAGVAEATTSDKITVTVGGTVFPWKYIPRVYRNGALVKSLEAQGRITYDFNPKGNTTIEFQIKQATYMDAYITEE